MCGAVCCCDAGHRVHNPCQHADRSAQLACLASQAAEVLCIPWSTFSPCCGSNRADASNQHCVSASFGLLITDSPPARACTAETHKSVHQVRIPVTYTTLQHKTFVALLHPCRPIESIQGVRPEVQAAIAAAVDKCLTSTDLPLPNKRVVGACSP